ncbi:2Fe-2S iron-sulfur cluster-binding protein [Streptomyces sp. NPDC014735]|uniref:2Fe-2S iron-sulfur cluster-binding protein n=1 Tax=unclassified Streptomyces TaxID=2593676 RepID=UPI0036FA3816
MSISPRPDTGSAAIDPCLRLHIVAQCGGNAQCATCHVYVDESCVDRLEAIEPNEDSMLDFAASPRRPNSRLSCQLPVTEAFEGLIVHLPERQH